MVLKFEWLEEDYAWAWLVDGASEEWERYSDRSSLPTHDQTIQWLKAKLKEQCNDKSRSNTREVDGSKT